MRKVTRRRNKSVTVRMNELEYADFLNKVAESGLTQQAFIIDAVQGATITSPEEIAVLKDISRTFADLERQLRGLATNVNQIAHVANSQGIIPTVNELLCLSSQLKSFRRESEKVWLLIRSSINQQKVMGL